MNITAMNDQATNARSALKDWSLIWNEDGDRLITHQWDSVHAMGEIVETMAKVVGSKESLFFCRTEGRRVAAQSTPVGERLLTCLQFDVQDIARRFSEHRVSPLFTVFKRYASQLSRGHERLSLESVDVLNRMVGKMRALAHGEAVTRRLDNLKRAERENARRVKVLLGGLRKGSKVLAVRLDVEYFSVWGPRNTYESQQISLDEVKKHRDMLLEYLRKGPYSQHLKGYIWKLEYGVEKGWHLHCAIFFDGQKVREDITIGDAIGEHWKKEITQGKGMYFNVNRKKDQFKERGVGMLTRNDDTMWSALAKALRYLTKVDYYVRFMAPDRSRTFGVGGVYKPSKRVD